MSGGPGGAGDVRLSIGTIMALLLVVALGGPAMLHPDTARSTSNNLWPVLASSPSDPARGDYLSINDYWLVAYDNATGSYQGNGSAAMPIALQTTEELLAEPWCRSQLEGNDPLGGQTIRCGFGRLNCADPSSYDLCIVHSGRECFWNRFNWWEPIADFDNDPESQQPAEYPTSDFDYGRCVSAVVWRGSDGHMNLRWRVAVRATQAVVDPLSPGDIDPGDLGDVEGTWNHSLGEGSDWLGDQTTTHIDLPGDPETCQVPESTEGNAAFAWCIWTASDQVDLSEFAPSGTTGFDLVFDLTLDGAPILSAVVLCQRCFL